MTCSLSAIHLPPKRTRMRRRSGSAYNNLLGSGSGTRNRPIAPGESGPCCQDSPIALSPYRADQPDRNLRDAERTLEAPRVEFAIDPLILRLKCYRCFRLRTTTGI